MESPSQWRLALARLVAERYATRPTVEAVFVGGSSARGQADRFSDVEMTVIWTTPPTETERADVVTALGGDLHHLYSYDPTWQLWEDVFFLGRNEADIPKSGCQIEMSHYLRPTLDAAVDRVLVDYDPDPDLQNLMTGILTCVPLFNAPIITAWQARLQQYPDGLQHAVLRRHGIIDHFWRWKMLLTRGDNRMEIATLLTSILHQALHLLLGLNRIYYGGFKWLNALIPQLLITPPDLAARIRHVYEVSPAEAAAEVARIVEQTFDLVAAHVPDVEVLRFRQIFTYERPEWEGPPPLPLPPL